MAASNPAATVHQQPSGWKVEVSKLFSAKDADFILCSEADGLSTHFRVHKAKLALSPVFANMFDCGSASAGDREEPLSIVVLPEPRQVVETLLRFLYNDTAQLSTSLGPRLKNTEGAFYEACFKYDMPGAAFTTGVLFV